MQPYDYSGDITNAHDLHNSPSSSDETRKLMRIRQKDSRVSDTALSKASDVNRKEIMIDGVVYRTASDAAVALNVHVSTVLNRARNLRCRWDTWKIIDRG